MTLERVSSSIIKFNGVDILTQNDFNQNVYELTTEVSLQETNTLSVEVRGKPGGTIRIELIQEVDADGKPVDRSESHGRGTMGAGFQLVKRLVAANSRFRERCDRTKAGREFTPSGLGIQGERIRGRLLGYRGRRIRRLSGGKRWSGNRGGRSCKARTGGQRVPTA